jgi:glycosyltransferase involved in cell wall biosynthesis
LPKVNYTITSISKIKNMRTILIQLNSNSLGDTIAIMPCVEYFMSKNTDNVLVKSNPRYNSLFKESYPNIKFYIRDDGSTDNTIPLIKDYFSVRPDNLSLFEHDSGNLGPAKSYFRLLSFVSEKYIFLSDQDDFWIPGRVSSLIDKISYSECVYDTILPCLVFSDVEVVDENLHTIDPSFWKFESNSLELNNSKSYLFNDYKKLFIKHK